MHALSTSRILDLRYTRLAKCTSFPAYQLCRVQLMHLASMAKEPLKLSGANNLVVHEHRGLCICLKLKARSISSSTSSLIWNDSTEPMDL
jgi:hypothetical protein